MNRALVFGCAGQLGVELMRVLRERGWDARGFERASLDITNEAAVESGISAFDPQLVFNCAAYNQVDVAESEPQAAYAVNSLAVRNIARACRQTDALLVHFSTDYVFDGQAGRPYVETDATHPLGAYAVSKLAGEFYAQAYLERPLIVRTSGVFGPGGLKTTRGNFVELMLRLAREGKVIRVVEDHVASPTYAPVLAAKTVELVERKQSGIFHVGGGTPISWFAFAEMIFKLAGITPELHATNEREYRTAAHRPKFSALENHRMCEIAVDPMPRLEEALGDYLVARERFGVVIPA